MFIFQNFEGDFLKIQIILSFAIKMVILIFHFALKQVKIQHVTQLLTSNFFIDRNFKDNVAIQCPYLTKNTDIFHH